MHINHIGINNHSHENNYYMKKMFEVKRARLLWSHQYAIITLLANKPLRLYTIDSTHNALHITHYFSFFHISFSLFQLIIQHPLIFYTLQ